MNAQREDFMKTTGPLVGGVYTAALRLSGSRAAAEDIVQETLLHAYQSWHRFEPGTNVRAWLHRIAVNLYITDYRRRRRERRALDLTADPGRRSLFLTSAQESAEGPEGGILYMGLSRTVTHALDQLSPEFRAVVVMADLSEMSYREIADAVGCPIGTVMSRLHRARRALARSLAPELSMEIQDDRAAA